MPKLLVDLKTQRGNVTPSKVELTNNFANTTYSSNQRGNEKVSVYLGETELSYITFTVEATLGDRIYVSTYGNDSNLGDFEEPLKTLEAAIAKNKLAGGDKTIYILNGTYEENDLEINDSVSIIGNESIISAKKLTISNNTNITNVKFTNFDIILHDMGNLMIAQSIFENNRVGICSTSEETASITNSTFIDNIAGVLGKNMVVDNVDFINNLQILVASSSNVTNSRFINNKVEFGADVLINDNNFSSTEVIALNANSTKIADNNFLNSTINATNSIITVYNNVFTDYDGYALDINSSNIDLKNNTISGLKSINIFNSTITNAIIIFMENSTYKFENGTIDVNATVTDDMGNPINGGKLSFDAIGETEIIDGFAAISDNFTTKGDYVISGGSDNFPDATILEGLIRINVENFWFIGDVGYETLADAIDAAETDDVIKGIPGEYEYDEINIGHRTRPSEPWVINKQITITSLTDEPITIKALGENIFDIDYCSNVTVINMIFMNAYHPDGWGGAIHSMGKNKIVVDNCTFMNNYAYDGGAIHAWGDLYVKDSLFIDNGARAYAGALFKDGDGNFVIENCKFINNTAETYAGAVYTMGYSDTYQIFTNITFDGNEATCAGALFTMGKNVTFTDCNFTNNRAIDKNSGYDPLGGAVYVHNGATKFINVRFVNNTAEGNGGALELDNGASSVVNSSGRHVDIYWAILENCLIENNTATGLGGAIYSNEIKTHVNITDSVIRNNEAYNAALFVNIYGFYVLDNVLMENNKNNGGDLLIYTYGDYSFPEPFYANTTIKNSILKNNSADIVLCAVSEYVVINVTDTQFDANGQILESELSRAYLTNLIETNSIANYTVNNTGTLSLSNNTFENPIYTTSC